MNRVRVFEQRRGTDPLVLDSALQSLRSSLGETLTHLDEPATDAVPDRSDRSDHSANAVFLLDGLQTAARSRLQGTGSAAHFDEVLLGDVTAGLASQKLDAGQQQLLLMINSETDALLGRDREMTLALTADTERQRAIVAESTDSIRQHCTECVVGLQKTLQDSLTGDGGGDEDDDVSDKRLLELEAAGSFASGAVLEYTTQRDAELRRCDKACAKIEELGAHELQQRTAQKQDGAAAAVDDYTRRVAVLLGSSTLESTKATAALMHSTYKHLRARAAP